MEQHNGFILPVVLVLATLASTLVVHCWLVTDLQRDIVRQRELWYKQFYATEVAFSGGVIFACKQFDSFISRLTGRAVPIKVTLDIDGIPVTGIADYAMGMAGGGSVVTVMLPRKEKAADRLVVAVVRYDQDRRLRGTHRCLLTKVLMKTIKGQETRFVVSHYTFDAIL